MKIYVDYDDCICETARAFSVFAEKLFGKKVPYEQVKYFNLQDAFELSDEQYDLLMIEGHRPEVLLSFEETPGASKVLNEWLDKGYEVSIITGRPNSVYDASRRWLDEHGLSRLKMCCLDKYGRDTFLKGSSFNLSLEDYYKMHFDFAVEDSPRAFKFFDHLPELKVKVFDRPWNRQCEFPNDNFSRCSGWDQIREEVK